MNSTYQFPKYGFCFLFIIVIQGRCFELLYCSVVVARFDDGTFFETIKNIIVNKEIIKIIIDVF